VGTGANDCPTERIAVKMSADTRTIVGIIVSTYINIDKDVLYCILWLTVMYT